MDVVFEYWVPRTWLVMSSLISEFPGLGCGLLGSHDLGWDVKLLLVSTHDLGGDVKRLLVSTQDPGVDRPHSEGF